ncbi:hypothetical protein BU15DRAFT_65379 [Melanogaster broomeanus]|nr:hypothetical protein BU15DRAFT_65379 [Melanogaster broomeanus]
MRMLRRYNWFPYVLCLGCSLLVLRIISSVSYYLNNPFSTQFSWPSKQSTKDQFQLSPNDTTLLVSAFFPLSHSKHHMVQYKVWLTNFLEPIQAPIYMFTTPELAPTIQSLRGSNPYPLTINTTFTSPLEIPPLNGLGEKYQEMWAWDRERDRHGPDLYAVWNGKPYFLDDGLKNAIKEHGREYEHAFWIDGGSFREPHEYVHWPNRERVREVFDTISSARAPENQQEELLLLPIWFPPDRNFREWSEDMGPVDTEFSEGSFIGGTPASIRWWREIYYSYHNEYLSRGIFVGKDQTLINAILLLYPERIGTVWAYDSLTLANSTTGIEMDLRGGRCGNPWYYFEWWLASQSEREVMKRSWDSSVGFGKSWWKALWFLLGRTEVLPGSDQHYDQRGCRMTNALLMENLLRRDDVFGPQWEIPARTVQRQLI